MKQLIDMTNKKEIGFVDWEFIHDMQGVVPDLITPEIIHLTGEFLKKIPGEWGKIKSLLEKHTSPKHVTHIAISDIENLGCQFKVRGTLKNKKGDVLDFHRVVVFDQDPMEDDFLGAVITDKDGNFSLAFGKRVFSDFGLEAEPDIYLKIYAWETEKFIQIGKCTPPVFEKMETKEGYKIFEFGVIAI
ncbi:MAG: hypothetical protein NT166_19980 [Candidatus Aminicenantes bacterium]|nr:hypothetical protein [Candidatus Aminicenantes bacterium]